MIKYLYIEDDPEHSKAFLNSFNNTNLVNVSLDAPLPFGKQIKHIKKNIESIDGLIIDLRLDDNRSKHKGVDYRGTSLAQEIRTKQTEKYFGKEFPIVIISTDKKIKKSLKNDYSSHNIFDYRILKDEIKSRIDIPLKLHSIANAYLNISENKKSIIKILNFNEIERIDRRAFIRFKANLSVHEFAIYFLNEIIQKSGILIDEKILAARFGVDISNSPDWENLKKMIKQTKYKGIYCEAWDRWWMFKINDWWEKKIKAPKSLASFDANKRVEYIKAKTKLKKIKAANPIKYCKSNRYWTICKALKKPLDPLEGFRILEEEPDPWQDISYISLDAILERKHISAEIKIHPLEKERLLATKKLITAR